MIQSTWAVLLCKFSDDSTEPPERGLYEDLFTATGVGSQNMVDFFRDVSHGKLDLGGTRVFGWYTLKQKVSDYGLTGPEKLKNRGNLINWARQAQAAAAKAAKEEKLSQDVPVVVCMHTPTDLFGGVIGVVCDNNSTDPRFLGQEMGHFYGLDHSRADGSTKDYNDFWDVMSTAGSAFSAPHPRYSFIGPGLNAANMASRGWLDESRVWKTSNRSLSTVVQLRPLHRRDLPGFLAARLGEYLVEFRSKEGWDAAIPRPAVLIHRFEDNISYLMSANNGEQDLVAGNFLGTPENLSFFGSGIRIEVIEIDAGQQFAKVRLVQTPADIPQYFPEHRPYRNPGVAWSDVGGRDHALIVIDGIGARISRRSPFFRTLEQIALYENSAAIASFRLQSAVREEALSTIGTVTQEQLHTLQAFRQPAPPQQTLECDGSRELAQMDRLAGLQA